MDDFLDFLRSGRTSGIGLGTREADVRAALGEPDDVSATRPLIWKYGTTEITFRDDKVAMIAMSHSSGDAVLRERLREEGLSFEAHRELSFDEQEAVVITASGVTLVFDLEQPLARAFVG